MKDSDAISKKKMRTNDVFHVEEHGVHCISWNRIIFQEVQETHYVTIYFPLA